jgi:beta-glucosidase
VFVAGVDETASDEEHDFDDLELPKEQRALLEAVFRANPKTAVVLQSGNPVVLRDAMLRVPALLEAWYPGQDTGNAVANALFGVTNPSGKLPLTFYASVAQLPPMDDYDIRHGRTYQYLKDAPAFPFGHGLSYSSFVYSDLHVTPQPASVGGTVHVAFDLRNTSGRNGTETPELYVADAAPTSDRPRERLVAFRRVRVDAGTSARVEFDVLIAELRHWNMKTKALEVDPGRYELRVGSSSSDIRLRSNFEVTR